MAGREYLLTLIRPPASYDRVVFKSALQIKIHSSETSSTVLGKIRDEQVIMFICLPYVTLHT